MKKIRKGIFAALAVFAAVTFFSCQSDDDDNSSSNTQNVEQPGTSDEGGTGSDSSGTDTSDTDEPGTSDETGTENGDSGTDTPNPELPGTPGGTTNPKDIFAGKTFYDSEGIYKDIKIEFSNNGTMTLSYNTYEPGEDLWEIEREYYYSIGDDNTLNLKGKALYLGEKTYSYSEALEFTESWDENYALECLEEEKDNAGFDLTTEQGKIDCISFLLSSEGIFLDKSIDYQTAINKYIEYIKNESKEFLDSMFSLIAKFKYIQNEDGTVSMDVTDSATFIDILSLDYSPFYFLDLSNFSSEGFNLGIYSKTDGKFNSLPADDDKTIDGQIYAVDETKIYGVIRVSDTYTTPEPYTEKVEFPYTTEGTGKNTIVKITYAGNTYKLTYNTYHSKLYPQK